MFLKLILILMIMNRSNKLRILIRMLKNKTVIWMMKLMIGNTLITKNSIKNICDLFYWFVCVFKNTFGKYIKLIKLIIIIIIIN